METFEQEVQRGQRFEFGKNWKSFLSTLDEGRIEIAVDSLQEMLGAEELAGKTFLDVGCGSGLFSLAARRLGAKVRSFDYDPSSVRCARELHARYFPGDEDWRIDQGSVLDTEFLDTLADFDVVYCWGVAHHTGDMWKAMGNTVPLVKKGGLLFIAVYNRTKKSKMWWRVKKVYCSSFLGRWAMTAVFIPLFFLQAIVQGAKGGINSFANYRKKRGMSITHDWFDWLGGYPYEVATAGEIFNFYRAKGLQLENLKSVTHRGLNQFVFVRE